ncbi:hypothetical protein DIPPA_70134 [Diplonema papillatum]|nr:hypothetical protein DIPPA_70134 [Diplonema papillatum]
MHVVALSRCGDERQRLEETVRRLGGIPHQRGARVQAGPDEAHKEWGHVTHCVQWIKEEVTLQDLVCSVLGHWVVSKQWLDDSAREGKFLPEGPYGSKKAPFKLPVGSVLFVTHKFIVREKRAQSWAATVRTLFALAGGNPDGTHKSATHVLHSVRDDPGWYIGVPGTRQDSIGFSLEQFLNWFCCRGEPANFGYTTVYYRPSGCQTPVQRDALPRAPSDVLTIVARPRRVPDVSTVPATRPSVSSRRTPTAEQPQGRSPPDEAWGLFLKETEHLVPTSLQQQEQGHRSPEHPIATSPIVTQPTEVDEIAEGKPKDGGVSKHVTKAELARLVSPCPDNLPADFLYESTSRQGPVRYRDLASVAVDLPDLRGFDSDEAEHGQPTTRELASPTSRRLDVLLPGAPTAGTPEAESFSHDVVAILAPPQLTPQQAHRPDGSQGIVLERALHQELRGALMVTTEVRRSIARLSPARFNLFDPCEFEAEPSEWRLAVVTYDHGDGTLDVAFGTEPTVLRLHESSLRPHRSQAPQNMASPSSSSTAEYSATHVETSPDARRALFPEGSRDSVSSLPNSFSIEEADSSISPPRRRRRLDIRLQSLGLDSIVDDVAREWWSSSQRRSR